MKLPLKWLKEYVEYDVTHEEFAKKLMWRGFEVEEISPELKNVTGVVVSRVKSVVQHPEAQKLKVCKADSGCGSLHTIVCGAPNVREGMLAPLALPGAKLPGNVEITPVLMRGIESSGMLCSGAELGITDAEYEGADFDGLLELKGEHALGTPIADALGLNDVIFNIELTANRPDCQSIIGMCREAASALGKPFNEPVIKHVEGTGDESGYAKVTVENTTLCPRYACRVVKDIRIEPSPKWMQKKLRSVGLRPINNIVDITNFVMAEYGHPMHAFDLEYVTDGHIVVRNAYEGEVVKTLDSKERQVDPSMLLIADPKRGVGIAGVMGGENSEIKPETEAILFEAAVFLGSNIRATARKLRHITDAAARFIKGVEPVGAEMALMRAMELVDELKAGVIVGKTIDVCAADLAERVINVDTKHINRILNTEFSPEEMAAMLKTVGLITSVNGHTLSVKVPHYRTDIESGLEADWDIAEEVARIYGYYNIEPTLMAGNTFRGRLTPPFLLEDKIKDTLAALGAYEMYNYNFISPETLLTLKLAQGDEKQLAVRIQNPFGEDQSLMRTTLIPGMLKSAALNLNRRTGHGRFFEVGNVHFDNDPVLAEERKLIGLCFFLNGEDFYTVKGAVEYLADSLGIDELRFEAGGGSYLHKGRSARVYAGETYLGELGEVDADVAGAFDVHIRLLVAELSFEALFKLYRRERTYRQLPRYPVVERDLALIADEDVSANSLKQAIEESNLPLGVLVENVALFDVFRGETVPKGKKSMAYSFTLRSAERTLDEADITGAITAILAALKSAGAVLRE